MKRLALLISILSSFFTLQSFAQMRIGYLSYDAVMHRMPEYTEAQQKVAELRVKYEQEATRGEEEFQRKFSEFLQGQKDFPENILVKRQAELQALMETGIKFRQEAQQLLSKAEQDFMAGVHERLYNAIQTVGQEGAYAAVLNTDGNQCPFINPALGEDITKQVLNKLGLSESNENEQ
ncbi:MAG: OmpH family outer membrane protein [Bacteroidaceae bacterium]|nr:OmpH family outer membrane protein [Bacteroidaceae bacterium]MBR1788326.1 OmpH family outer membrane protein [Bacteroidaceae bacterium]